MNFSENDVWREKTKLPNFKLSKLARAKVLLNLEFDIKDQVLFRLKIYPYPENEMYFFLFIKSVKMFMKYFR